jgi:hypothetical protein
MTDASTKRRLERLEAEVTTLMNQQTTDWLRSLPMADLELIAAGIATGDGDDPDWTDHERELVRTARRIEAGLVVEF